MHVGEQDRVDVLRRDAERGERGRQPAGGRPERLGGAGVDQQRPVAVADEVRGDPDGVGPGRIEEGRCQRRLELSSGGMLTKKLPAKSK